MTKIERARKAVTEAKMALAAAEATLAEAENSGWIDDGFGDWATSLVNHKLKVRIKEGGWGEWLVRRVHDDSALRGTYGGHGLGLTETQAKAFAVLLASSTLEVPPNASEIE